MAAVFAVIFPDGLKYSIACCVWYRAGYCAPCHISLAMVARTDSNVQNKKGINEFQSMIWPGRCCSGCAVLETHYESGPAKHG